MNVNDAGRMVEKWFLESAIKFSTIKIDEYIVMPNHFHAIVIIRPPVVGADLRVCPEMHVCAQRPLSVGADLRVCPEMHVCAQRPLSVGADLRVCPETHVCAQRPLSVGADLRVCPESKKGEHAGSPLQIAYNHKNISSIMQWFKTMTTNEYIRNVKTNKWPSFAGKLWQRNYYDHIGRDENELFRIRQYIRDNPQHWETDEENIVMLNSILAMDRQ
ncbi:MAG: hypothetical protein PHC61_13835 [Chitinivibrionales bacterium]|nr:hypothetical protein [Chitinivibrionales bacterium]